MTWLASLALVLLIMAFAGTADAETLTQRYQHHMEGWRADFQEVKERKEREACARFEDRILNNPETPAGMKLAVIEMLRIHEDDPKSAEYPCTALLRWLEQRPNLDKDFQNRLGK